MLTKTLQAVNCDLGKAYEDAGLSKEAINKVRAPDMWIKLWDCILSVANANDIEVGKPRTTASQKHRAHASLDNTKSQSPQDYYRINVYFAFIDHVVLELNTRSEILEEHKGLIAANALVPTNLESLQQEQVSHLKSYY